MAARLEAYNESPQQQAIGKRLHNIELFVSKGDIPTIEINFARRVQELQKVRHTASQTRYLYLKNPIEFIFLFLLIVGCATYSVDCW